MRAVNLLPRVDDRKRGKPSIKRQLAYIAPMLVAALVGAGYLFTSSKVGSERATLRALQEAIAQLPPAQAPPPPVDAALVQQDAQRIFALSSALATRVAWDRILREISSILPEDVWLTGLSAQSPGLGAAPVSPPQPVAAPTTTDSGTSTAGNPAPATGGATPPSTPSTAPLVVSGYTYSQEGVARFLARLGVIPELGKVKLESSLLTNLAGRPVVQFTIDATLRDAGAMS